MSVLGREAACRGSTSGCSMLPLIWPAAFFVPLPAVVVQAAGQRGAEDGSWAGRGFGGGGTGGDIGLF